MITDWLTTILALRWVLIVGGLDVRLRASAVAWCCWRAPLMEDERDRLPSSTASTGWTTPTTVSSLTAFILSWLAGAIDESGHISAAEGTRRCACAGE